MFIKQNIIYIICSIEFTEIKLILNLAEIKNLIQSILIINKLKNLVIKINL